MKIIIILLILLIFVPIQYVTHGAEQVPKKMLIQYYEDKLYDNSVNINSRLAIIDTILSLNKNEYTLADNLLMQKQKGDLCLEAGLYSTAMTVYGKILDKIDENSTNSDLSTIKLEVLLSLGKLCYFTGKYDAGISYLYDLLKINGSNEDRYSIAAHSLLGTLFSSAGKVNIAKSHLKEALKKLEIVNHKDSIMMNHKYTIYNCFAAIYSMNKDYDSSLIYLKQAYNYCNNDPTKISIIYQNTAVSYTSIDEWNIAEEYFIKALQLETRPYEKLVIMNNLAMLQYKQHRYKEALELCNDAIKMADNYGATHVKGSLLFLFSDIQAVMGNYKLAFEYNKKGLTVFDSVYNAETEYKTLLLNNDFEMYKIENDKKILEYKVEVAELGNFKKTIIIVMIAILFTVVLTVAIIISRRLIKQNKVNKMMKNTIDRFDETTQEIIQSSKEHFETEINRKARELTANAIFVAKMCDVANNVSENIKILKKYNNSSETEPIFKDIQSALNSLSIEEKGWEEFKIYFEQVHSSFFPNLNSVHHDLTPGESRMCAFIIMNLSTKEIASLTNRSIRTVDTVKFRIRRKLNIPSDVTTSNYLKTFIS